MQPLVRATLAVRTLVRRGHGLLIACGLAAYVVYGGAAGAPRPAQALAVVAWAVLLGLRVARKVRVVGDAAAVLDVEIGALLSVALGAGLVRIDGGLSGPLSPALYVLVALVASFARPAAALAVVVFLLGLESALRFITLAESDASAFAAHAGFVGAFALLNLALLRAEVARVRATARARIEAQLVRIKEDARSYRLLGAGEGRRPRRRAKRPPRARERRRDSPVRALRARPLRRSLDLHTAVLLWLNDAGTHLRISELSTASDECATRRSRRRRGARRRALAPDAGRAARAQAVVQGPLL